MHDLAWLINATQMNSFNEGASYAQDQLAAHEAELEDDA
jgi:hypothetical protein